MNKQQTMSNHEFKVECKLINNKWKQSPTFLQNLNRLLKIQNWDHIETKSHLHVAKLHPYITLQSITFLFNWYQHAWPLVEQQVVDQMEWT